MSSCRRFALSILIPFLFTANTPAANMLRYENPATYWLESLPVGNGRIGAMVFGGVASEKIALDDTTFWSGSPDDHNDNPGGPAAFAEIRRLFVAGKYQDTEKLIPKLFGRNHNYGTNLPAGNLLLDQTGVDGPVTGYRRGLSLDDAVAFVQFTAQGTTFRREVIASHPGQIIAMRLTADHPGSIGFTLGYDPQDLPSTTTTRGNDTLLIAASAFEKNQSDGKTGVALQARVRVIPDGGKLSADAGKIRLDGANAATILVAIDTSYRNPDPATVAEKQLADAEAKTWPQLLADHTADYKPLFDRVTLTLGDGSKDETPTDARLAAVRKGVSDPGLSALFFQYGRYLLIAGSRADSPLPMHLQGIWNDGLAAKMAWTCDYHLDINTQQNYWPAEVCNLSECADPLFRLIESLQAPGHVTAKKTYGIDHGWVAHTFTNPWGYTSPGGGFEWGLHVTGGAWIATHLWEHYLFTGDKKFLADQAYPVLKGSAEFFLDYLFVDPATGKLLTGPSISPERGHETDPGAMHDREMIWQIFTDCIEGSKILGIDDDFRARCEAARAKLPPFKIGRNGQLQEWFRTDDGGKTNHRHTSHLAALFPLSQINPHDTPDLAKAAEVSLQLRMNAKNWEDVEWSAGNAVCYYARLCDGDAANRALVNLLSTDTDNDLLTFSRGGIAGAPANIFVVDGNCAGTAGIAEMLLQSYDGEIDLLPALPKAWPDGRVTGLCARGGFTVDITWAAGKVTAYRITSAEPRDVRVRVNGEVKTVRSERP
jgi:alpha-L-fucosidase 2